MTERPDRMTCEEAFRRLDAYIDRTLSAEDVRSIRDHLEVCAVCAREYKFEESIVDGVRSKLDRISAPPDLMDKITRRLSDESS